LDAGAFAGKYVGLFIDAAVAGGGQESTAISAMYVFAHYVSSLNSSISMDIDERTGYDLRAIGLQDSIRSAQQLGRGPWRQPMGRWNFRQPEWHAPAVCT
jgi:hypothetical protein